MIEELIGRVFCARNAAHLEHWRTKSYAQHKSLGKFYDDIISAIDGLVEAYQGVFPLIKVGEIQELPKIKEIVPYLEEELLWIGKNRDKITQKLPALDNKLQELEGVYMQTLYKLKNLS